MDMPQSRYPVNPTDVEGLELPSNWAGLPSKDVGHMNRIIRSLQHTHEVGDGGSPLFTTQVLQLAVTNVNTAYGVKVPYAGPPPGQNGWTITSTEIRKTISEPTVLEVSWSVGIGLSDTFVPGRAVAIDYGLSPFDTTNTNQDVFEIARDYPAAGMDYVTSFSRTIAFSTATIAISTILRAIDSSDTPIANLRANVSIRLRESTLSLI